MAFQNALLIQTAFIGDVVLTTPMIAAFKRFFPESRLTLLVKPEAVSILEGNPHVDEILVIDKKKKHRGFRGMIAMRSTIRERKFDLLLSPHQSHRTSLLSMFSGIPVRVGYLGAGFAKFAYNKRLKRMDSEPEIRRLIQFFFEAVSLPPSPVSEIPEVFENDSSRLEARNLFEELRVKNPVLVAPSSVWPTKRWTPWGFAELIVQLVEKYHSPVLLIGGPDDARVASDVENFIKETKPDWISDRVFNICGKTSLKGLYSIMVKSRFLVSNDSAPIHFACAAKIPVVAIFGPTTPALGYAPIAPRTTVAEIDLPCRPCGTHGGNVCPLTHFDCMKKLTPAEVLKAVQKVVS